MPKTEVTGFCDFNINADAESLEEVVIRAFKLGYENIAINNNVSDEDLPSKKSKKGTSTLIPDPAVLKFQDEKLMKFGIKFKPKIFSRITITISDPSLPFLHKSKEAIKKYDIIAYKPLTEAAFKHLCQANFDVDIMTFDSMGSSYRPSRKLLSLVAKSDIYFELSYSPCIRSPALRKITLQTAIDLHSFSRSKNIIITSGARNASELRSPYDVMNLGLLFGLTHAGSRAAVSRSSSEMFYCSEMRRTGKSKCSAEVFVAKDNLKKRNLSSLFEIDKLINDSS